MRKMIALGFLASIIAALVGCSTAPCGTNAAAPAAASVHHDYKGEKI